MRRVENKEHGETSLGSGEMPAGRGLAKVTSDPGKGPKSVGCEG